jgi:hypothetical protein
MIPTMFRSICRGLAVLVAAAGVIAVALDAQSRPDSSWAGGLQGLRSPAGANSGQPHLSGSAKGVLLSWIERDGPKATLRFAERTAAGWSAARDIASGTDWFVNWADVPSIVRLDSGDLAAHWLQKSGSGTYAYDVRLSHSRDGGRTWSPSFLPHSDGTKTEHGFASLFQMPGAGLGLAWLDGRGHTQEAGGSQDGHGGGMSVHFATFTRGWQQTTERLVDDRVCECCPTAAAVTADGPIVAYRDRSADGIRDIVVSRLEGGKWSEPKPVHADGWKIAACPVNGPMLSARGRDVVLAWFTGEGDRPRAQLAFSSDAGRTFGAPIRLDDAGSLGRVDVDLLDDGSAVASWIEFADQKAQFRVRRVDRNGTKSTALTVSGLAGGRASGYPRIAAHGTELVLAWTEAADSRSQVMTATVRLK